MKFRDRIKSLRRVRAGDLKPNPKNWRLHTSEQTAALRGVLERVGFADAVLARELRDGSLELIDGQLRAGIDPNAKIPVLVLNVTKAEADLLLATGDSITAMAGTDKEMLNSLVACIDTEGINDGLIELLNDLADDVESPTIALIQDQAPEVPKKAITKPGDVWQLGSHRLLCGDSSNSAAVKKFINVNKPKLMVTDPPYGVEYDASWRSDVGLSNSGQMGKVLNDNRASWASVWNNFPGDVVYVWHAALFSTVVERSLMVCGFDIRSQIIWFKHRFAIGRGNYHWRHEPCWYAVRKGSNADWSGDRKQDTVWASLVDMGPQDDMFVAPIDDETLYAFEASTTTVWKIKHDLAAGGGHSTQKPVECMGRPMKNHGKAGDYVFDPFVGSGTSIIAAEQLDRRCLAIELSPAYCDAVVERWETFTGQSARRSSKAA